MCLNLAVQAQSAAKSKIALIDLDPQHSLTDWYTIRAELGKSALKKLDLIDSSKDDIGLTLMELAEAGYDYAFIDSPPVHKPWLARVMAFSDLLVLPTKATSFDISAAQLTLNQAREKNIPARWLLSGVILPKPEVRLIVQELLKMAKVCPGVIKECSDVVRATAAGLAVHEFNLESPAARAFWLNWSDLLICTQI